MLLTWTWRCNMPALWQSSQRPMYIRTVWVDGFRHAILTHDDPCYLKLSAKRRPHSSASAQKQSYTNSRLSHRSDDLQDCLRKLQLVNEKHPPETSVEELHLSDVESEEEIRIPDVEPDTPMAKAKSNRTARTEAKDTDLSDRVLQWLDLAGKVDLLKEDSERISQPRHSWPEIQRRNLIKSKTSADLKAREPKTSAGPIDRQEIYVTTSNTIENYARQSRNPKTRHEKAKENKRVKDMKPNIVETRQKVVMERTAVEKQYAELVNKKLIPDVGKTKKQVHIFMPEALPKRTDLITSRTQSLLSQKL
ncbi:unnamed protein product [Leptosia nina]|uniref:Uncharacterized protein n=1 Tax=Leptosia nina TaxID=320188 RepID=A0AAV1JPA3_9NEOP